MAQLNIRLFGKFEFTRGEQHADALITGRIRELMCFLLLHRGKAHSRETLAGQFWGETSTAKSRKYLRKALWQLQTALASEAPDQSSRMLKAERDWLSLDLTEEAKLDVACFEEAFASTRTTSPREMTQEQARAVRTATELYRGDLLEGWYQDWCLYDRERLQNVYLAMLDKLVLYYEASHQVGQAITCCERLLQLEPAHEVTHQRLMNFYDLVGDRTSALRQYRRCCQALRNELGVSPSQSTLEVAHKVRGAPLELPKSTPSLGMQWNDLLGQVETAMTIMSEVCGLIREEMTKARQTVQDKKTPKPVFPRSVA